MKKRILSIIIALCMVFCLVPTTALAATQTAGSWSELQTLINQTNNLSVTLSSDISWGGSSLTVPTGKTVTLDLNGKAIDAKSNGTVLVVNGTLTIKNSGADLAGPIGVGAGPITGNIKNGKASDQEAGGILVAGGGKLVMNSGWLTNCVDGSGKTSAAGGIYVSKNAVFEMTGGIITGCVGSDLLCAAGVVNYGTFTMSGNATVSGSKTSYNTDGVAICNAGTMNANGGTVQTGQKCTNYDAIQNAGRNATVFYCNVLNTGLGTIKGGTYHYPVENAGTITGGTFNEKVTSSGAINDGIFNGTVDNTRVVTGGTFNGTTAGIYTVTFDSGAPSQIRANYPATAPDVPTKRGYTFNGWLKDGKPYDFTQNVTQNLLLTADWSAKSYTVKFDTNGGTTIADKTLTWDDMVLEGVSDPTKPGYDFTGWAFGDRSVLAETTYADLADNDTVTSITLTAKWTAGTYTVTFDGNGGTVAQRTMRVTYGEPLDQMPIPRYKGYFFRGWYDEKWGGRQYGDEDGRGTYTYDKAGDCTLYAMWEEAPLCTVTFDPNGGILTGVATCEEKQNECIREPSLDEWPVREGHNFLGWYTDAACKPEQKWDFDDPIPGNMTLYAGWEILSYVIRVKPENGEQDILIDQNYGTTVTPPTLTRPGYIFAGWDSEFPAKMPAKILTITARWTVCDHSGHTGAKPTCTTSVICTACGGEIAALGHDFSASLWQHDVDIHWKKCSRCEAKNDENPHDWDSGKVTVKPTCMTAGEKIFTCDKCGATKNESIQANGHSWAQEWQHDAAHHWHECLNADCDIKDNNALKDGYGEHTGGAATCTAEAVCASCHQPYGEKNPENHEGGTQQWTTRTAYVHEKKWSCCGAVTVASEAHEWSDGVCSECGYVCLHDDAEKNHICDICEKIISNHEDANKDHICDYCEKVISNHEDADKNHICDYCEKVISNHEDADKNHICDYCEKVISNHEDADKNHICDYCEKIISNHEDTDKDHICDFCGKVITNHTGGEATCKDKAVCEFCGKAYGELDATNHADLKHFPAKAASEKAAGNIEYWYCGGCGKYFADAAATKEIAEADTVKEKLPKSPQTGESSRLWLWLALLLVSGGALIGTAVTEKKKRLK